MMERDAEAIDELLNPGRDADRARASELAAQRLRQSGVRLTGRESDDDLTELSDALDRFEQAVQIAGGDLMVDEAPDGHTEEPDDPDFALPERGDRESVLRYCDRLDDATEKILRRE